MSLSTLFGFDEPVQQEKSMVGVHLIDFSQIVISTITATCDPKEEFTLDYMRHICLNTLRSNVAKQKKMYPTVVVCVDNRDGYWRRDVAYYYKKNRADKREESEWDWKQIFLCLNTVVAELKEHLPYIVIDKEKTEADDTIGVLTKYISVHYPNCKILITSSDGDFTQLHKFKNLKQWSPMGKNWVKCKHGSPRNDLRFKIMKGDKKDAIASINSRSDYVITKEAGERAASISTVKLLTPVMNSDDPLSLLTDAQKERYKENEILLDFEMIPSYISRPIIDEFNNSKPAPRSKLYPYLVSKKLIKLIDCSNDF